MFRHSVKNCRICGTSASANIIVFHELMFGTGEEFHYFECAHCGCIQIDEIPRELGRYYPANYYASVSAGGRRTLRDRLLAERFRAESGSWSLRGYFLKMVFGADSIARMIRTQNIARDAKILDIGCGDGRFLDLMHRAGYHNLAGIDPFLANDTSTARGVPLYKKTFDAVHDTHDFIMFHHSLEHMPDPVSVFVHLSMTLSRNGVALIRVPLCDSEAYRLYGVNWIQADPPRHLYLFTRKSIELMAVRHGFVVDRVVYDSTAMQLWGSEQVRLGIPLCDKNSYFVNKNSATFTRNDLKNYALRANEWNLREVGDQAAFFLRRANK